jgi:hypothetical protein
MERISIPATRRSVRHQRMFGLPKQPNTRRFSWDRLTASLSGSLQLSRGSQPGNPIRDHFLK